MAVSSVPSPSVQAKARALLDIRNEWHTIRDKGTGRRRVVVPSLTDGGHVYYVDPEGRACSCKAGQCGILCGHQLAVREAASQDALEAFLSAPVEPARRSYRNLFPSCKSAGCDDLADGRDGFCGRCASDREWQAKLEASASHRP